MTASPNYYELLQVDPRASQEVIDAAYRSLARKFHPDLNKAPDAAAKMQQLNVAYATLSDPDKRAEYDRNVNAGQSKARSEAPRSEESRRAGPRREQPGTDAEAPFHEKPKRERRREQARREPPIVCENCGRFDHTLRAAAFQYVISIVILSFKRGGGGILCSTCRTSKALGYTVTSILFGPWGLPWGVFWTLEAILRNLSGGKQPAEVNGPLLRSMAAYYLSVDNQQMAIHTLEESLKFETNSEVQQVLRELRQSASQHTAWNADSVPERDGWAPEQLSTNSWQFVPVAFLLGLIIAGAFLFWMGMTGDNPAQFTERISRQLSSTAQYTSGSAQTTSGSSASSSRTEFTATPLAALTPSATETVAEELVDAVHGWRIVAGQSYMQGNAFHVDPQKAGYSYSYTCSRCTVPANFTYNATISKIGGPDDWDYGIVFRAQDYKNFYVFSITGEGYYRFMKYVDGEWTKIVGLTLSHAIKHGNTTNNLQVSAEGSTFGFYINDQFVNWATDTSFSSGLIGVIVGDGTIHMTLDSAQVRYDSQVASLSPASAATPAAPTATRSNTIAPTATPTSMWLLAEDFVSPTHLWPDNAKTYLENGLYHVKETEEGYSRWAYCLVCDEFSDLAYEAMITKLEGPDDNGYGISFRKTAGGEYVLWIAGDGSWKFESYTTKWNAITQWSYNGAINRGNSKNKIRVVARGTAFEFYVNDQLLGTAVDSAFSSGDVGFGVGTIGLHIAVQYIRVWNPNGTALVPPTSSFWTFSTPTRSPRDVTIQGLSQGETQTIKDAMDLLQGCSPTMFNYVRSHVDTVTRGNKVPDANAYIASGSRVVYLPQDGSINDPNRYTDSMRTFVAAIALVHESRHVEMGDSSTEPDAYKYTLPLFENDKCVPNDIGALTVIPGGVYEEWNGVTLPYGPRDSFPKSYCPYYILRKYTEWRAALSYPKEPPSWIKPPEAPWQCLW